MLEQVLEDRERNKPKEPLKVLLKKVSRLDYIISTQAISPKFERKIAKRIEILEEKIAKWREIMAIKRRINRIEREIERLRKKIRELEEEKRKLEDMQKGEEERRRRKPRGKVIKPGEEITFTIADIGIIKKK